MSLYQYIVQQPRPINMMEFMELGKTSVLRADQFSDAKVAVIHDENGDLLAKQIFIKLTASQGYCVLLELDPKISGKDIKVKNDGDAHHLKLVSIESERKNRRLLPIFVQFHTVPEARPVEGHLTDRLSENVLGRFNLELKKNVTIDSFIESDSWRDEAGFIVTDRNTFVHATFDTSALINTLLPSTDANIIPYSIEDLDALCDFDNSVCGFNRDQAVEFLAANSSVYVAKGSGGVDGIIAGKDNKVVALYAETLEIAHALMKFYINQNKLKQVSFFTRTEVWECAPHYFRPVYRRHTRAVPGSIKWGKVYALNMGFHII